MEHAAVAATSWKKAGLMLRKFSGKLRRLAVCAAAGILFAGALPCGGAAERPPSGPPSVSAKGAAVVELVSGRLLYGRDENRRLPMASTTKIMTGLLACESGQLDRVFTVPADAIRVEGSSMGLVAGEKITLRDLVYGLMLESGNDAANTIAACLAGSVGAFVEKMNDKARSLGLANTHFVTPSGLDADGHYTTALDLARLAAAAMQNADFEAAVSSWKKKVSYEGAPGGRTLTNHNRLLQTYVGAIGVKTGFTKKCGRCLVSCAVREGVCVVAVTLSDPRDWDDHAKLLDYGFSVLRQTVLTPPALPRENVVGGLADTVPVALAAAPGASLREGEQSGLQAEIDLPKFTYAPVAKGQKLGELVYKLNGTVVSRTDLLAAGNVGIRTEKKSFFRRVLDWFAGLFGR